MITLLPIFILIVSIFAIGFIISRVLGSRIWTVKVNGIVLVSYITLGLIAMIVLQFTTKESEMISKEEMQEIFEDDLQVWNGLRSGQTNSKYEDYLKEESQIELTTNQFVIKSYNDNPFEAAVVVERRDDPDSNIIHAKTYVIPYQYKGIDFTEKLSLDYFEFNNDELVVKQPQNQEIQLYRINPRMEILAQFKVEDYFDNEVYYIFSTGKIILYLNVPSHVTIIDESGYIDFVE